MTVKGNAMVKPPMAPSGMAKDEVSLWDEIITAFPQDWFRTSDKPLLIELVRAYAMSNKLAKRIDKCRDVSDLKTLLQLRDVESRRAAALATKLRIPPQSRSDRHVAGVAAKNALGERPWMFGRDETDKFFGDSKDGNRH
jgi:hypothetical protein